jgi:hypothetical protein
VLLGELADVVEDELATFVARSLPVGDPSLPPDDSLDSDVPDFSPFAEEPPDRLSVR